MRCRRTAMAGRRRNFLPQQIRAGQCLGLMDHGHIGADPCIPERRKGLLHRHVGRAVRLAVGCPGCVGAGGGLRLARFRGRTEQQGGGIDVELAPVQLQILDIWRLIGRGGFRHGVRILDSAGAPGRAPAAPCRCRPPASAASPDHNRVLEVITPPACRSPLMRTHRRKIVAGGSGALRDSAMCHGTSSFDASHRPGTTAQANDAILGR